MFEIERLKRQNPKKYPLSIIIFVLLLLLIILSYSIKTYDTLSIVAITNKANDTCNLEFVLPYNKITMLNNSLFEYNNKEYKIKNIKYIETTNENNILYEKVKITSNLKCPNKVANIKLLNNKQRIITKIINIIKEE